MAILACVLATIVTLVTARFPLYYTDAEAETVGRITYYGWPLPWLAVAPGYSLMYGLQGMWKIPINWCLWLMFCVWLCGFRTKRSFLTCLIWIYILGFAMLSIIVYSGVLVTFGDILSFAYGV